MLKSNLKLTFLSTTTKLKLFVFESIQKIEDRDFHTVEFEIFSVDSTLYSVQYIVQRYEEEGGKIDKRRMTFKEYIDTFTSNVHCTTIKEVRRSRNMSFDYKLCPNAKLIF